MKSAKYLQQDNFDGAEIMHSNLPEHSRIGVVRALQRIVKGDAPANFNHISFGNKDAVIRLDGGYFLIVSKEYILEKNQNQPSRFGKFLMKWLDDNAYSVGEIRLEEKGRIITGHVYSISTSQREVIAQYVRSSSNGITTQNGELE